MGCATGTVCGAPYAPYANLLWDNLKKNIYTLYQRYGTSYIEDTFRSSLPEVFFKKGVFRNFVKLTAKYLCQSLF